MSRLARLTLAVLVPLLALGTTGCDTTTGADIAPALDRDLARVAPETVGMSSERLARLDALMQSFVDDGRIAGITTMIARHGKIVHSATHGSRDIEAGDPMPEDAIFRIYSMSKPITGVALMQQYELGRFRLSDPVSKHIPQLKDLRVAKEDGPDGAPITEPAHHEMTVRELMSHTGGLTYGVFSRSQVDDMYNEAGVLDTDQTLADMIDKLAAIPLRQQPGTRWHYSVSVDVQGYLVEVLSGQPFDEYLKEHIFDPLGMTDTGFHVPEDKADRLAQVYAYAEDGSLIAQEGFGSTRKYTDPVPFFSGGGGLVGSTMDYMRFCQMLLNGGELDGARILAPNTVQMMRSNQMPRAVPEMRPGLGFGLDFAVVTDPVEAESFSEGEYYWSGAAGTWFWIDPVEDLAFVGMLQHFGQGMPDTQRQSRVLTYASITDSLDI